MADGLMTAIGLGVVQGVTEFLPISSDGHLALFALAFHVREASLATTVTLHLGTLLATLLVFRAELRQLAVTLLGGGGGGGGLPARLASPEGKLLVRLIAASVPTAAIGLALEHTVEPLSALPWAIGLGFLGSAVAVFSTRRREGRDELLSVPGALLVGVLQGLAVLPGLSRSASTIATAMALGLGPQASFRFSFLLSMPAVAGAALLELGKPGVFTSLTSTAWIGAGVSFVTGIAALQLLRAMLGRGRFWAFGVYLVPLGAGLVLWDLLGR